MLYDDALLISHDLGVWLLEPEVFINFNVLNGPEAEPLSQFNVSPLDSVKDLVG